MVLSLQLQLPSHDQHTHRLLSEIEAGTNVSQRSLARSVGIALGLTNLLLRRLVHKGWVRMIHVKPNRVSYLLTPAGLTEKARMSRAYLESSVKFYAEARNRISERFAALSAECCAELDSAEGAKRIVFYGSGEVAEIGYICLVETDLQLVGVVDAIRTKPFFGFSVCSPEQLDGLALNGQPFDQLVIMSLGNIDALRAEALARRVPLDHVAWL